MPPDLPLTREQIVATAEDVIRRFGPAKATVVDVARALGVSHAAVYRHVSTKAALRDLVVQRWIEMTMPGLRAVAEEPAPAIERLRRFLDTLIATKRRRAAEDPEVFTAYRALTLESPLAASHQAELVALLAGIIEDGIAEGTLRAVEPSAAARGVLTATFRFHHPLHAAEWTDPGIDALFEDVWRLVLDGLRATPRA